MHDVSKSVPGGIPLLPGAAALLAQRTPWDSKLRITEPKVNCFPLGPVFDAYDVSANKFIQVPGLLVILKEYNKAFRQIFMDGRALPVDPEPLWDGYSVGHWKGDTLVVQTIGLNARSGWLDERGHPFSEAANLTERYHREDFGHLTVQMTVDDPKYYSKPWSVTLNKTFKADDELEDFISAEGERDLEHMRKANELGANK